MSDSPIRVLGTETPKSPVCSRWGEDPNKWSHGKHVLGEGGSGNAEIASERCHLRNASRDNSTVNVSACRLQGAWPGI